MMALVLVLMVLTCERNLLTRLLGGWVPSPALFRRPSWNLSVIFRWGWDGCTDQTNISKQKAAFHPLYGRVYQCFKGSPRQKLADKTSGEIDPPKKTISGGTSDGDEEEIWRSLRWKSFDLARLRISNESETETLCDCQFLPGMA